MSRLFFEEQCATLDGMTPEQQQYMDTLRYMLAELLEKQSSVLTAEQRQWHKRGIKALKAAVDAIEVQVYA